MDKYYTKLFHRILSSSIWEEDDKTRLIWITLLASTDEDGLVIGTVGKLARDARVDPEACKLALAKFIAPDPESLSSANQGRRVEVVEGGWRLMNHRKYRDMMNEDRKREYFRVKRQEYRAENSKGRRKLKPGESLRSDIRQQVAEDPITIADAKAMRKLNKSAAAPKEPTTMEKEYDLDDDGDTQP